MHMHSTVLNKLITDVLSILNNRQFDTKFKNHAVNNLMIKEYGINKQRLLSLLTDNNKISAKLLRQRDMTRPYVVDVHNGMSKTDASSFMHKVKTHVIMELLITDTNQNKLVNLNFTDFCNKHLKTNQFMD